MKALSWAKFWAAILPELIRLARQLFTRHAGDVEKARAELHHIRDHGARLQAAEDDMDERLERVREREEAQMRPRAPNEDDGRDEEGSP